MIADLVIITAIVLFIIIGIKRGIAKTLLNLAGLVLTVISANYLSSFLAQFTYDTFIKQSVITNLEQIISENGIQYAIQNCFDAVPGWISGLLSAILSLFGTDLNGFEKHMNISYNASLSVAQSVEKSVSAVVIEVFGILLAIILFIVIFILVKKLIKLALKAFKIPVIKQINMLLGGVLGAVEGMIFVWLAVNIFFAVMAFTNPTLIESDYVTGNLFRFFCIVI